MKQFMEIKYFQETDTLYIEFRDAEVSETRDLDENTLLDLDCDQNICAITIEHAGDLADFCYQQVLAQAIGATPSPPSTTDYPHSSLAPKDSDQRGGILLRL